MLQLKTFTGKKLTHQLSNGLTGSLNITLNRAYFGIKTFLIHIIIIFFVQKDNDRLTIIYFED